MGADAVPRTHSRIAIFGVTGSGKSTLAQRLGAMLGLPVIELDAIHWRRPGWEMPPEDQFRAEVLAALQAAGDCWVVEGNYRAVRGLLLQRADTAIWLRYPWRVSFWRLLKRTISRSRSPELLWGTQRESLAKAFFSRESILWWSIHHHRASARSTRSALTETPHAAEVFVVRSPRDLEVLVGRLAATAGGVAGDAGRG
jgi:adenylate kinase family enzyme